MHFPVIIKILFIFILILSLNKKFSLGVSLFSGALVLCMWLGFDFSFFIKSIFLSLKDVNTISLILIVAFILILSAIMRDYGQIQRMVESFKRISKSPRLIAGVMPALIGLLPMPGGALFSAPMVEIGLGENKISPEEKTIVNYWFRHIWEYWWPLYPGVVLAVALLKVPAWEFILVMCPLTIFSVLGGKLFLLKADKYFAADKTKTILVRSSVNQKSFFWEIAPIIIVVFFMILTSLLQYIFKFLSLKWYLVGSSSILPSILASLFWVVAVNKVKLAEISKYIVNKKFFNLVFLVTAIMIFKGVLVHTQAVNLVRVEMTSYHIPLYLIILLLPFLSGLITGIAIGFVGASFPLIIPLFPKEPGLFLFWAGIAYLSGYMGMMFSPVHLCFLVTKDYFKASLLRCYSYILKPAFFVIGMGGLFFSIGIFCFTFFK